MDTTRHSAVQQEIINIHKPFAVKESNSLILSETTLERHFPQQQPFDPIVLTVLVGRLVAGIWNMPASRMVEKDVAFAKILGSMARKNQEEPHRLNFHEFWIAY
jgi:hypothetical protein